MKNVIKLLFLLLTHVVFAQVTDTGDKVGIGTATPAAKLEIKKTGTIGGVWNPSQSYLTIDDGGGYLIIDPNEIYSNSMLNFGSKSGDIAGFRTVSETANSDKMIIKNNGNVGIGTANPSGNLHVSSGTSGDAILKIEADIDNNNESDNPIIQFRQDGDIVGVNMGFSENFGENNFGIGTRNTINGGDKWDTFIIDIGSNSIGIGTSTPDERLAVNGNIHTKEVRVDLIGWSDFVFNKDYNLPTLKEVEQHIKEKGHLKDIPSVEDVEENEIFLGDMNAKLLQKIEELTLYTIEQQKLIENQNDKIDKLEKESTRLQTLSKRLADIEKLLENKK